MKNIDFSAYGILAIFLVFFAPATLFIFDWPLNIAVSILMLSWGLLLTELTAKELFEVAI